MVRHIILWQLKDELSEEEKNKVKVEIKEFKYKVLFPLEIELFY